MSYFYESLQEVLEKDREWKFLVYRVFKGSKNVFSIRIIGYLLYFRKDLVFI